MNRTRKTGLTLLLPCAVLALTMGQVQAETCDATASIDSATKTLSAAKQAGGEWRLIDKSTGSASQPISKLLKAAKKKLKAGARPTKRVELQPRLPGRLVWDWHRPIPKRT